MMTKPTVGEYAPDFRSTDQEGNPVTRQSLKGQRTTFILNAEGRIEKIFDKVDTANHYQQILKTYKG